MSILTTDKITEIFCITDDFCKEFSDSGRKKQSGKKWKNLYKGQVILPAGKSR
jgi:hypothetical protein